VPLIIIQRPLRQQRATGDHDAADKDVEAILDARDIAPEQQMAARLKRAKWRIAQSSLAEARVATSMPC
jgi:hypothetical protein